MSTSQAELESIVDLLLNSSASDITARELAPPQNDLGECHSCNYFLPWPLPTAGAWAAPASCPGCRRWYYTQSHSASPATPSCIDALRRQPHADYHEPASCPPGEEFLSDIVSPGLCVTERRQFVRYPITRPIVVIPLDKGGRPQQECLDATLLDISAGGAGFYTRSEVTAECVVLDFGSAGCPGKQVLARICWTKIDRGLTKAGCEFVLTPDGALPLS